MGIYDREYYRDDEPKGFFVGGSWSAVGTIVFLNAVVYVVTAFLQTLNLTEYLALRADLVERLRQGEVWHLAGVLTYGFAHDPESILHILFNMFMLWVFGREVEGIYGKRLFWRLYLSLIVIAGVCWMVLEEFMILRSAPGPIPILVGASGAVAGVAAIFILHYPTRLLYIWGVLPVPAWFLAIVWLASQFFGQSRDMAGDDVRIAYSAHLAGALFGAIFYRWHWTLFSLLPTHWISRLRHARRRDLRVVREVEEEEDLDEQVDRILAKISRYGTESLTEEEQRTLEAASRRAQRRRGVRSD